MKTNLRNFIGAVDLCMITLPFLLPSRVWMFPPSIIINMGFGHMGKLSTCLIIMFLPLTKLLAVCDVDTKFCADSHHRGVKSCSYNNYKDVADSLTDKPQGLDEDEIERNASGLNTFTRTQIV